MTLLSRENCHGRSLLRPEIESNSSDVVPIKSQGLIFFCLSLSNFEDVSTRGDYQRNKSIIIIVRKENRRTEMKKRRKLLLREKNNPTSFKWILIGSRSSCTLASVHIYQHPILFQLDMLFVGIYNKKRRKVFIPYHK